jgi:hypothetical protein
MIGDWCKQDFQLRQLAEQAQRYLSAFRWLWLLNLAAAVVGVSTHHYYLMVVAAASSVIALIGVAFARIGQRTVSAVTNESHKIRRESSPPE